MTTITCPCGTFKGAVRHLPEESVGRMVCYCSDCRRFMAKIGREDELDPSGGLEFVTVYPGNIQFTAGQDKLSCQRLSEKGLNRWVVTCCGTAVGTSTPKLPFLGLIHSVFSPADREALGPVKHRLFGCDAVGEPPAGTPDKASLSTMASIGLFILKGYIKGKGKDNPFFKADQQTPISAVTVLAS